MQSLTLAKPLAKNLRVSSRVTIQNPRPRKYASDAERQKAFRERQAVIQVRVKPETVETFDRIASTLGYTRQEVVYALLMSGLNNNRNWQQTGIPGFRMPRYEDNPMKKKPTPAQLAARERFAEMARSGAFKRKAKAAPKRKKNPLSYGLEGTVKITDTYERSVSASRNLAEHYANQLRMRGRDDIVYVVFGITPEAKKQAGRYKNGVTITLDPRDYEIAYAFHPTQGEISQQLKAKRVAERRAFARERIGRMPNPAKKTVSQKISQLVREGYPQPQAVAIALSEERKGKVRKNPADRERKPRVVLITNPKGRDNMKYAYALVLDDGGFTYGMDARTPVTFEFSQRDRKRGVYTSYQLPSAAVNNPAFQAMVKSLPGQQYIGTLTELRSLVKKFM